MHIPADELAGVQRGGKVKYGVEEGQILGTSGR